MKNIILLLMLLLASAGFSQKEEHLERIKAEKVAFITEELELTSKDAQAFWPVYNEYSEKIDVVRKKIHKLKLALKDYKTLSEKDQKEKLTQIFDLESQENEIKKRYLKKFEAVVTTQKAVGVFVAEEKFKRHLLHKLKEHHRRK